MAARTMGFDSDSTSKQWHLGRKMTLLVLLVIALALGLVILSRQKSDFPLLIFNVFADATIGLVAGLAARVVLRRRNWFIRGLACAALVIIGLLVLGYFTNEKSGVMLPPAGFGSVNWQSQLHILLNLPLWFGQAQMNWIALVYLVIAIDTSWITLRAWKRSTADVAETTAAPSRQI